MKIHELPRWAKIVGVWCVVGALLVGYVTLVRPKNPHGPFRPSEFGEMLRATLWMGLTFVLVALNRRWPLLGPGRKWRIALHAGLSLAVTAGIYLVRILLAIALEPSFTWRDFVFVFGTTLHPHMLLDAPVYWVVLGFVHHHYMQELSQAAALEAERRRVAVTFASSAAIREASHREEQLRAQLVQAELAALKQQLHPHFLFNALNTVSSLVLEAQRERAVEALAQLSGLLRRLMTNAGRQWITLAEEMDYIDAYLAIEQMRFEERLVTRSVIGEECRRAIVPAFLLQPIVENAIKHGVARRRSPGRVEISAGRAGGRLRVTVFNDPAEAPAGAAPPAGQGLGLETTRARLQLAHGEDFVLERDLARPEGAFVSIEIPWMEQPPA